MVSQSRLKGKLQAVRDHISKEINSFPEDNTYVHMSMWIYTHIHTYTKMWLVIIRILHLHILIVALVMHVIYDDIESTF